MRVPPAKLVHVVAQPLGWLAVQLEGFAEEVVPRDGYAFLARLWREWSPGWEPTSAAHLRRRLRRRRHVGGTGRR